MAILSSSAISRPIGVLRVASLPRLRRLATTAQEQPSNREDPSAYGFAGTRSSVGEDEEKPQRDNKSGGALTKSQPYKDEINTLLRHPTLYDPILAPRLPIVLCHGLYGFDVRGPAFFKLHYWGELLKILRGTVGAEVFVTAVPGTGAIAERAKVLHKLLEELDGVKGKDINLIAHSMGGLDARYLLSNIRPEAYHPQSLTTISTPHRGSDFMAWCRANIGIGTASVEVDRNADGTLPFSLKSPLLTRPSKKEDAKSSSDAKAKENDNEALNISPKALGKLPSALSGLISKYLLDLLDSPAYANLTPAFCREKFNPSTPDRDDIRYFSVAARTDKISIWHPLWLPKVVLDETAAARAAKGIQPEPHMRGNDGLVSVESAKWGEFLGIVDGADHWEVRGSSGLVDAAASAKAMKEASGSMTQEGQDHKKMDKSGWTWQDVYRLIGKSKDGGAAGKVTDGKKGDKVVVDAVSGDGAGKEAQKKQQDENSGLNDLATWISGQMPGALTEAVAGKIPLAGTLSDGKEPQTKSPAKPSSSTSAHDNARMLYGSSASRPDLSQPSPSSSTLSSSKSTRAAKPDKFNLERMVLAVCRKLHNEGL